MSDHTYDTALSEAMLTELYSLSKRGGISAGWGRAIGAGIGAVGGGLAGRQMAPEEEKTLGTIKGSLVGLGAGLLGGQFATQAGRGEALRFGQRQLHGATGYLPGRGAFGTAGKKLSPESRLKALEDIGFEFHKGTKEQLQRKALKDLKGGKVTQLLPEKLQGFWAKRRAASQLAHRQLAEEGMTSLPGLAKGYFGGGVSGSVTPWQAAKMNIAAPGLAMGIGVPALMSADAIREYRETGDTKAFAGNLAGNIGFAAGGGLPATAMMGLGSATGAAGKLIGRGIGALKPRVPVQEAQPAEQVVPR